MKDDYKYSDFEIIDKLLQEKDSKWFAILYDRYASMVYNKCIALTNNNEIAKDLTHDIFIKAFLNISKFKKNSTFYTWIYSITYNICIDYLKKSKQYITLPLDDESWQVPQEEIDDKELLEIEIKRLKILLEKIPTDDKLILLMKFQDNMKIQEIGQILNIGESATKMRINRAKKKISELHNSIYRHNLY